MYARDPEIIEAAFDTGLDPLDALENPPAGRVGGYSHHPGSINVDQHTRSAAEMSSPEAPTATDAF